MKITENYRPFYRVIFQLLLLLFSSFLWALLSVFLIIPTLAKVSYFTDLK